MINFSIFVETLAAAIFNQTDAKTALGHTRLHILHGSSQLLAHLWTEDRLFDLLKVFVYISVKFYFSVYLPTCATYFESPSSINTIWVKQNWYFFGISGSVKTICDL